jgi:hypothetical protein
MLSDVKCAFDKAVADRRLTAVQIQGSM